MSDRKVVLGGEGLNGMDVGQICAVIFGVLRAGQVAAQAGQLRARQCDGG